MSSENAIALIQDDGKVWTTSLDVAEKFDKRHDDVLRKIRALECPPEFNARNFTAVTYRDGKGEERPCIRMTRDGFAIVAMGFTGPEAMAWKVRFLTLFNAMESQLVKVRDQDQEWIRALAERQVEHRKAHTMTMPRLHGSTQAARSPGRRCLRTSRRSPRAVARFLGQRPDLDVGGFADKRRCVEIALREFPAVSSRQIADWCGVSHHTVEATRQALGNLPNAPTVTTKDGKQYPAKREKAPPAEARQPISVGVIEQDEPPARQLGPAPHA